MHACQKGKAGEREAAHYIHGLFPGLDMRRGAQHAGNADAPDIKGFPGVHWEVKRAEKLNIHAAMAQAVRDAEGKSVPVVLHRRNRGKWLVTLEGDNLCAFTKAVILANQACLASNAGKEADVAVERVESNPGAECDNVAFDGSVVVTYNGWTSQELASDFEAFKRLDAQDTDRQTMPTDQISEQEKMP